ncbi:MAG: hypothetical protein AAGA60_01500 [Cyanobacteria bacterium P01_E01_bin.42]
MSDRENNENVHYAASRMQCKIMARLNGWELVRIEPTNDPILKAKCVFKGKQTSFMEDNYHERNE